MEYSFNFNQNLPYFSLNDTIKNTSNWIEENREKEDWAKDPNAFEMTNIFLFAAKYKQEGKEVNEEDLDKMWNMRSKDFENCNISENYFTYQICKDSYESVKNGKSLVNDENSHHALRKMAGLGLFFKQQQRDNNEISYNNPAELVELLESSKSLKTFHPDLYKKYQFDKNLDKIVEIQLSENIPDNAKQEILDKNNHIKENIVKEGTKSNNNSEIEK